MAIFGVDKIKTIKKIPIPGYEELYYATSEGEVWHKKKHRKLSVNDGCVSLRKDGENKGFKIKDLIYMLFIDPDWDHIHKINQIDGDSDNYSAKNLTCKSLVPDLPGEIWKPFEEKYEVSSLGRVRYVVKDILCAVHSANENSMSLVNINSKTYRIDELVAKVFLDLEDDQCVYHKDGDIHNYVLDNLSLEVVIPSEEREEWYDVPKFEGRYKVSNYGKVYSLLRKERRGSTLVTKGGYFLSTPDDEDGYPRLTLVKQLDSDDSSKVYRYDRPLHRFIAETFIPNPHNYTCVNHIDGNKHNNRIDNLEWCTNMQNMQHSIDIGLRSNTVYNNPNALPTIVVDLHGVKHRFESIQQASYYLNVDSESLRLYLHGQRRCCTNLDPNYRVYITSKDDYENVVIEPHIRKQFNGAKTK